MSETRPTHFEYVLVLTAFAAGATDVISFTKLGGIFASAMTGNLALLGLYVARGSIISAIGSLIALLGFISGVAIGTLLTRDRVNQKAVTVLLASQMLLLVVAAVLWFAVSHRSGRPLADLLILILANAMGCKASSARKINLSSIPTVVFTSTLTNIVTAVTDTFARGNFSLSTDTRRQIVFAFYYISPEHSPAGLLSFCNFRIIIFLPLAAIAAAFIINSRRPAGRAAN